MTPYRRLLNELLFAREAEGGELPVDEESSYVERLDKLWWELSEDERNAETGYAPPPAAPASLGLVDREVRIGDRVSPRRAVRPEDPKNTLR